MKGSDRYHCLIMYAHSFVNSLQFETEDLTLSQNSLPGEFDYTEPVQS